MSQSCLTAAFGPSDRWRDQSRGTRLFGDLIVGGSAVLVVHDLLEGRSIRFRPGPNEVVSHLVAGFALMADIEPSERLTELRALVPIDGSEVSLSTGHRAALCDLVRDLAVTVTITRTVDAGVQLSGFPEAWSLLVADARPVEGPRAS